MTETVLSARNSSELERGEIPEVAAVGNALTALFNTLDITQNAYAIRVSMDKSIVSRYLRGRRVPTQDFIDRLVREVEARRSASVQPEVRGQLTQLRLNAIKVTDPATYELEALRAEMVQSERKIQTLVRHQEALHDLLEKREAEVRTVQGELEAVRRDWTADLLRAERVEIVLREETEQRSTERARLAEEIARLKAELSEIASLKAEAEQRCSDLEAQVRAMEEELATRLGTSGESQLPLAAFKEQLAELVEAGEQREASREVVEAAWGRPVGEIADLVEWLAERRDHSRRDRMITEVVHARTVDELAEFGHLMQVPKRGFIPRILINETAAVRSPQEIARLHTEWPDCWAPKKGSLLNSLLRSPRHADDVVETLSLLDPNDTVALDLLRESRGTSSYDRRYARIVARLEDIGCRAVATALCERLTLSRGSTPLRFLLHGLDDQQCAFFTSVLLRSVSITLVTFWLMEEFNRSSGQAGNGVQLDQRVSMFVDALKTAGRLPEVRSEAAIVAPNAAAASSFLKYLDSEPPQPE